MKLFIKFLSAFFIIMTLLSAQGCGSTHKREATGEYVDDSVITTKVKAELVRDPNVSAAEVNVETFKGEVQLSGFVSSRADMDRAIEIARGVTGVVSVKNKMNLK
ncbi:BON domain-containing protein [Crenothrix sp.]|uniref:BON domain-containing protein n=1 Tax=Crenothrix sp. TaxID=3100433 RepID=UPI00374DAA94